MKKIFVFFTMICVCIMLAACDSKTSFKLELVSTSDVRESVAIDVKLTDPKKELKDSTISASIYEKGSSTVIATKSVSMSGDDKDEGSVTFTGLTPDTEYTVKFFVGYNGKNASLLTTNAKTSTQGTEENPYLISTKEQFTTIVSKDPSGYFKMTADIDFEQSYLNPLFTSSSTFKGYFDGNNHKVSNFVIGTEEAQTNITSTAYIGFFGYISALGTVKDLTLDSFDMNLYRSSRTYYGILAGYNAGTIDNVDITNSKINIRISSASIGYCGGVVGYNTASGVIKNCDVSAKVKAVGKRTLYVGGIAGTNSSSDENAIIENCKFNGEIDVQVTGTATTTYQSSTCVGGISGDNYTTITGCQVNAKITVYSSFVNPDTDYIVRVGGVTGWNISDASYLTDCTVTNAEIKVTSKDIVKLLVGSITGQNGGDLTPCYAKVTNASVAASSIEVEYYNDAIDIKAGAIGEDKYTYETAPTYTEPSVIKTKLEEEPTE